MRRGLVVGEVGRGTFVAGDVARGGMAGIAGEPRGSRIDLEFNFPILPSQAALIAKSLEGLDRPDTLQAALQQSTSIGTARIRQIAAQFLACEGWSPQPGQLVFTGNGRQSIAAVLAALVPTGGRCGIEAITYPFAKGVATQLGITLVPLAMDEHGVRPDAVQKAHREGKLSAIYVQPVIHNPLGMTMPQQSRAELLRVAEKLDLVVIEDFDLRIPRRGAAACQPRPRALRGDRQPFKAHRARPVARLHRRAPAPARGHHGGGPHRRLDGAGLCVRCRRAADERRHRGRDHHAETRRCEARQQVAVEMLKGLQVQTNPKSYHLWLVLPEQWRSQTFVAAAARHDIALTPSSAFAVNPGHAPNAIRLALAQPPLDQLREALATLAHILKGSDEDGYFTE